MDKLKILVKCHHNLVMQASTKRGESQPNVKRKIAHLVKRKRGGCNARVRDTKRVDADFRLIAAPVNLALLVVHKANSNRANSAVIEA